MKSLTMALLVHLMLAACAGGSGDSRSLSANAANAANAADTRLPAVRSPGKAIAPLGLAHRFAGKAAVGMPLEMVLTLTGPDAARLAVAVSADDALALVTRPPTQVAAGATLTLQLVPTATGRFYVDVAVADRSAAGLARVFTIPVQVGSGGPPRAGKQATVTPAGERLVRMRSTPPAGP